MSNRITLGEFFNQYAPGYIHSHKLTSQEKGILRLLSMCRSGGLGAHKEVCTQCGYCEPCESEVNIRQVLKQLIHWDVYGWDMAKRYYNMIGKAAFLPGKNATGCTECGECLDKCPQGIPIIDKLKEAHEKLAEKE